MADVIAAAHAANPNGWELTLEKSGKHLRLNAGAILLIQVERDWTTLEFAVDLSNDSGLLPELVVSEPFKILPEVGLADVEDSDVARVWPEIRDNCLRAAAMAASKRKRVTWYWAHSQEAVDALAEVAGRSLPEPDYVKLLGSEPLEELYAQFLEDFASQAKGPREARAASRVRSRERRSDEYGPRWASSAFEHGAQRAARSVDLRGTSRHQGHPLLVRGLGLQEARGLADGCRSALAPRFEGRGRA